MARRLEREEGIFCGISSGCNMVAAVKLGRAHPGLLPIVVLACDAGEARHVEVPEREQPLDARSQTLPDRSQARWEIIG